MDMGRLKENESLFHSMSDPPVTLTWPFGVKSKHKPIFTNKSKKKGHLQVTPSLSIQESEKKKKWILFYFHVFVHVGLPWKSDFDPYPLHRKWFFVELRKTSSVFPLSEWFLPPLENGFCRSWGRLVQFFPLFEQFLPPYPFHTKWFSVGLRMALHWTVMNF